MPRVGGPELATRLRPEAADQGALQSGYTDDTLVMQEIDPSQAFLQKPYTPSALSARVRALLDVADRP